ncbi:MAG: hypothetical protein ACREEM_45075, partial [Blastocatellia bacterium]
ASDRVRFCTRCSFPISPMKEFLTTEASKGESEEEKKFYPLRQNDISLGAGLMLGGVLKAVLLAFNVKGEGGWVTLFVTLGVLFSAGLLLSQLSPRQRGLTVGTTIVFLGAMLGALTLFATNGFVAPLAVLGLFFGISLFWMPLMRTFRRIFLDEKETAGKTRTVPAFNLTNAPVSELPPAQHLAVADLDTQQMKQAEKIERFSVTEDSTSLLKQQS